MRGGVTHRAGPRLEAMGLRSSGWGPVATSGSQERRGWELWVPGEQSGTEQLHTSFWKPNSALERSHVPERGPHNPQRAISTLGGGDRLVTTASSKGR